MDTFHEVYNNLKNRIASRRNNNEIHIGDTGASKILFALNPNVFIPWDEPIRKYFRNQNRRSYIEFLKLVKRYYETLQKECKKHNINRDELPAYLNRNFHHINRNPQLITPLKLIDEYFWVTITKKCEMPSEEELEKWIIWLR